MAPFQSLIEAGAGKKTQLRIAFFPCIPSSLTGTNGSHYTAPYGCDTSEFKFSSLIFKALIL